MKTDSFEVLAAEYIELYHSNKSGHCTLHENVGYFEQVLFLYWKILQVC